jgi:hypothetical protein
MSDFKVKIFTIFHTPCFWYLGHQQFRQAHHQLAKQFYQFIKTFTQACILLMLLLLQNILLMRILPLSMMAKI